jgi:hypothetical protein
MSQGVVLFTAVPGQYVLVDGTVSYSKVNRTKEGIRVVCCRISIPVFDN